MYELFCARLAGGGCGGGSCPRGGGTGLAGVGGTAGFAMKGVVLIGPEVSKTSLLIYGTDLKSCVLFKGLLCCSSMFLGGERSLEAPIPTTLSGDLRLK